MPVTHNIEWTIERGDEDAFDVCIDYTFRAGHSGRLFGPPEDCFPPEPGEVEFEAVWRKSDEHRTDVPAFELTADEAEKIELYIIQNPPEPDYPEDYD